MDMQSLPILNENIYSNPEKSGGEIILPSGFAQSNLPVLGGSESSFGEIVQET